MRWLVLFLSLVLILAVGLLLLGGCQTRRPERPTLTFEAEGYVKQHAAEKTEFIRRTAPAYAICQDKPDLNECVRLEQATREWERRDVVLLEAMLMATPVRTADLEAWLVALRRIIDLARKITGKDL